MVRKYCDFLQRLTFLCGQKYYVCDIFEPAIRNSHKRNAVPFTTNVKIVTYAKSDFKWYEHILLAFFESELMKVGQLSYSNMFITNAITRTITLQKEKPISSMRTFLTHANFGGAFGMQNQLTWLLWAISKDELPLVCLVVTIVYKQSIDLFQQLHTISG